MKGLQISFYAAQNQTIEGKSPNEWLIDLAKEIGIAGVTTFAGMESYGNDGRRHSAHFFELADQPIQIMMAVSEEQGVALFAKVAAIKTRLFYIKTPVEYGEIGG